MKKAYMSAQGKARCEVCIPPLLPVVMPPLYPHYQQRVAGVATGSAADGANRRIEGSDGGTAAKRKEAATQRGGKGKKKAAAAACGDGKKAGPPPDGDYNCGTAVVNGEGQQRPCDAFAKQFMASVPKELLLPSDARIGSSGSKRERRSLLSSSHRNHHDGDGGDGDDLFYDPMDMQDAMSLGQVFDPSSRNVTTLCGNKDVIRRQGGLGSEAGDGWKIHQLSPDGYYSPFSPHPHGSALANLLPKRDRSGKSAPPPSASSESEGAGGSSAIRKEGAPSSSTANAPTGPAVSIHPSLNAAVDLTAWLVLAKGGATTLAAQFASVPGGIQSGTHTMVHMHSVIQMGMNNLHEREEALARRSVERSVPYTIGVDVAGEESHDGPLVCTSFCRMLVEEVGPSEAGGSVGGGGDGTLRVISAHNGVTSSQSQHDNATPAADTFNLLTLDQYRDHNYERMLEEAWRRSADGGAVGKEGRLTARAPLPPSGGSPASPPAINRTSVLVEYPTDDDDDPFASMCDVDFIARRGFPFGEDDNRYGDGEAGKDSLGRLLERVAVASDATGPSGSGAEDEGGGASAGDRRGNARGGVASFLRSSDTNANGQVVREARSKQMLSLPRETIPLGGYATRSKAEKLFAFQQLLQGTEALETFATLGRNACEMSRSLQQRSPPATSNPSKKKKNGITLHHAAKLNYYCRRLAQLSPMLKATSSLPSTLATAPPFRLPTVGARDMGFYGLFRKDSALLTPLAPSDGGFVLKRWRKKAGQWVKSTQGRTWSSDEERALAGEVEVMGAVATGLPIKTAKPLANTPLRSHSQTVPTGKNRKSPRFITNAFVEDLHSHVVKVNNKNEKAGGDGLTHRLPRRYAFLADLREGVRGRVEAAMNTRNNAAPLLRTTPLCGVGGDHQRKDLSANGAVEEENTRNNRKSTSAAAQRIYDAIKANEGRNAASMTQLIERLMASPANKSDGDDGDEGDEGSPLITTIPFVTAVLVPAPLSASIATARMQRIKRRVYGGDGGGNGDDGGGGASSSTASAGFSLFAEAEAQRVSGADTLESVRKSVVAGAGGGREDGASGTAAVAASPPHPLPPAVALGVHEAQERLYPSHTPSLSPVEYNAILATPHGGGGGGEGTSASSSSVNTAAKGGIAKQKGGGKQKGAQGTKGKAKGAKQIIETPQGSSSKAALSNMSNQEIIRLHLAETRARESAAAREENAATAVAASPLGDHPPQLRRRYFIHTGTISIVNRKFIDSSSPAYAKMAGITASVRETLKYVAAVMGEGEDHMARNQWEEALRAYELRAIEEAIAADRLQHEAAAHSTAASSDSSLTLGSLLPKKLPETSSEGALPSGDGEGIDPQALFPPPHAEPASLSPLGKWASSLATVLRDRRQQRVSMRGGRSRPVFQVSDIRELIYWRDRLGTRRVRRGYLARMLRTSSSPTSHKYTRRHVVRRRYMRTPFPRIDTSLDGDLEAFSNNASGRARIVERDAHGFSKVADLSHAKGLARLALSYTTATSPKSRNINTNGKLSLNEPAVLINGTAVPVELAVLLDEVGSTGMRSLARERGTVQGFPHGDKVSYSIAAARTIAEVARDVLVGYGSAVEATAAVADDDMCAHAEEAPSLLDAERLRPITTVDTAFYGDSSAAQQQRMSGIDLDSLLFPE